MNVQVLEPTGDRLVIIPTEVSVEQGGVLIPEIARDIPNSGRVLCCGPSVQFINAGDEVIFTKYAGTTLNINSKNVIVLHENDIIAVIERAKILPLTGDVVENPEGNNGCN